jgi:hypothetical protein
MFLLRALVEPRRSSNKGMKQTKPALPRVAAVFAAYAQCYAHS